MDLASLNRSPLFVDVATWREFHARRRAIGRQGLDDGARRSEMADLLVWALDQVGKGHGGWHMLPGPTAREVELVRMVERTIAKLDAEEEAA